MFKRCSIGRTHPYCGYVSGGKDKSNETPMNNNAQEFVDLHKSPDATKVQIVGGNLEVNEDNKGKYLKNLPK